VAEAARGGLQACLEMTEVGFGAGESGQQEVQYFAANILHTKVKRELAGLPEEHRQHLLGLFGCRLRELHAAAAGAAAGLTFVQRFALVLGSAGVEAGPEAAHHVAGAMLGAVAEGGADGRPLGVALQVLLTLAEGATALEAARRAPAVRALNARSAEVFTMSQAILTGSVSWQYSPDSHGLALMNLSAWMKLDETGTGMVSVAPGPFCQCYAELFRALLSNLHDETDLVADRAAEVLVDLLGPNAQYGEGDPGLETQVLSHALGFVVENHERLKAKANCNGPLMRGAALVVTAVGDRDVSLLAANRPEALQVADVMLGALSAGDRGLTETCIEYFLMLNTVPLAERHPGLHTPLWTKLVVEVSSIAQFPSDFTTWEEALEDDEDSFHRFREQSLGDALDTMFGVLKGQYLQYAGSKLQQPGSWQEAEAAVFTLRIVAVSVKAYAMAARNITSASPEERDGVHQFLVDMFALLVTDPSAPQAHVFRINPEIVQSLCRLIGSYAAWLGKFPQNNLGAILQYLLSAMALPGAFRHAATAFRNVCSRCANQMSEPANVNSLVQVAQPVISSDTDLEGKMDMVEGIARIISTMSPADAAAAGEELLRPLVERIQQLIAVESNAANADMHASALAANIRLMAYAIGFLEFNDLSGNQHPALRMMEGSWFVLNGVLTSPFWGGKETVVAAVCEVLQRALLCTKEAGEPLLGAVLPVIVAATEKHMNPHCLVVIGSAVEVLGTAPSCAPHLRAAFEQVSEKVLTHLQQSDVALQADIVGAMFDLAGRYLVFSPSAVLQSRSLSTLITIGVSAVRLKERQGVRSALAFLGNMVSPGERLRTSPAWSTASGDIHGCFLGHARALVSALLLAAADTCPQSLLRSLASCLHGFHMGHPQVASECLVSVLGSAEFQQFVVEKNPTFRVSDFELFRQLLMKQLSLPKPRYESLVYDFARLCRREASSDVLLGYQSENA
jgi:hypothetical protein